ncbi:MAG: SDR family NAD(P)-dependent oxidoreductase [Gemmatimonadales bacterium]|nr:SDR family NAD(P)-dependent oxidoreductase [Gemmatimonadales bacterium]
MTGHDVRPLALVTGASRGIGAATATALVGAGYEVIRLARSPMPPLAHCHDLAVDLADAVARADALAEIRDRFALPEVVVSNAGSFLMAPLEESSDELLREQLAINLEAPFAIARSVLPRMRLRGYGTHVLVGSVADLRAYPENAAYAASKFAARGLHEVLLEEMRGSGVRCTLVSPGPTDTAIWDPMNPDARGDLPDRAEMLRPSDVADAILYAVSAPRHVQIEVIRLGAC